jgi:hypothetical protein
MVTVTVTSTQNLTVPDLTGLNDKTFSLADTLAFSYPLSGVTFAWSFSLESPVPSSLATNDGFGSVQSAGITAQTTSAPRYSLADAGLTPGTYQLTVTVTQGSQTKSGTATITLVAADLSGVEVFPNPWRSDKHAGHPSITFANLPTDCSVKIFTVSGRLVKDYSNVNGTVNWDLTDTTSEKVASGIYIYLIASSEGSKVKGKVAVIK